MDARPRPTPDGLSKRFGARVAVAVGDRWRSPAEWMQPAGLGALVLRPADRRKEAWTRDEREPSGPSARGDDRPRSNGPAGRPGNVQRRRAVRLADRGLIMRTMDRHESKARIDGQINEWKNNLETLKAKAAVSTGEARVGYQEKVGELQKQLDDLKIQAAAAWDVADDSWDSTRKDLELKWAEWEVRAKQAWGDLTK